MEKDKNLKKDDSEDKKSSKEKKKTKKKDKQSLEIEALKEENEQIKKDLEDVSEKALRAVADLENFKKRTEKTTTESIKYYNMQLIEKLLIPLDQFNLVVNAEVKSKELKNYLAGFKMINEQIFQILQDEGLKKIKTDGEQFDPKYHHAAEKESNKEKENGEILRTTQTGYLYKDRVVRPAIVTINEWSEENGKNK